MARILIVGCGAIGRRLAHTLTAQGHDVTALKRTPPPEYGDAWHWVSADISQAKTLARLDDDYDRIVLIVSADGRNEASYRQVYQIGVDNVLARFSNTPCLFVSSTSVYGQTHGEWVDERSPAEPDLPTSQLIRLAEQTICATHKNNLVVRFSGIYGPGREHLLAQAKLQPTIQQSPPYFTNRIHEQDCVGVLAFLLLHSLAGTQLDSYYLASDDNPAPVWEVMHWLASELGYPPPVAKNDASQVGQNKRCHNQRLKALGYRFIYPSFREGYSELIHR